MVLITSILAMLLFGAMGLSIVSTVSTDLAGTNEDQTSAQAFNVADGGMQYILQNRFVGDSDFSDNVSPTGAPFGGTPISLNPGQFWVEYSNQTADSIDVKVTSRVGNAVRVVNQSVEQGGSGIDYACMANGNLNFIDSDGDIYGDVALRGVANIDPDVDVHGDIVIDPSLEMPTMDVSVYEAMCTSTYTGNLTISTNTTSDLCVYGNVTIDAGVTYTGLLYSSGNITLNGNNIRFLNGTAVALGNINADNRTGLVFDAAAGMPSIVNTGNANLTNADGVQITGVIWCSGNMNLDDADNAAIVGSFMSGGNFNMNDVANLSVTFDADLTVGIPGLTPGGGAPSGSLSLTNWKAY